MEKKFTNGDIVNYTDELFNNKRIKNAVVQYNNKIACFTIESKNSLTDFDWVSNVEIIGNIYDNKDLLKGE